MAQPLEQNQVKIKFWGVRGSIPLFNPNNIEFGTNTSCVSVQAHDNLVIFDAGTGIIPLGRALGKEYSKFSIFLSHLHWDHIMGIPFFAPLFRSSNQVDFYSKDFVGDKTLEDYLHGQMQAPYFPVGMDVMAAEKSFYQLKSKDVVLGHRGHRIIISSMDVPHPNGCLSYSLQYNGKKIVYCTDTESLDHCTDELCGLTVAFNEFVRDADILIYDSHFSDEEYLGLNGYSGKQGWGHSTWQEATRIALDNNVGELILFHHSPHRTDDQVRQIEKDAQALFSNTRAAYEGLEIIL